MRSVAEPLRSGTFTAAPQALGYLYQVRYALLLLLRIGTDDPEAEISIEQLDDVAFEQSGQAIELLQFKHHISAPSSLTDYSSDLWKTLRVWASAVMDGTIQLNSTILTMITTGQAPDGSAASKLRPQAEFRDVEVALGILLKVASESKNEGNASAYKAFTELTLDQQRSLLHQIRVIDLAPNISDVRLHLERQLRHSAKRAHLELLVERLEGWWAERVIQHLLQPKRETIKHRELEDKLGDIRDAFRDDNLPIDFPDPIEMDEEQLDEDHRIFVKQLKIVSVDVQRLRKAIGDFYRASEQRSRWVRECLLLRENLESYEVKLIDEWERQHLIMKEDCPPDSTEEMKQVKGRSLFNWVDKTNIHIRPRCTEPFVTRGSYHILSNQLKVGWHPDFRQKMSTTSNMNLEDD